MAVASPYVFYGLASRVTSKVFDWYATPEDAEGALEQIVDDEPDLDGVLYVASVYLGGVSPN